MAIKFAYRSNTDTAYYSLAKQGGTFSPIKGSTALVAAVTSMASAIGGNVLDCESGGSGSKAAVFPGFSNTSNTLTCSILCRFARGATSGNQGIFAVGGMGQQGTSMISVAYAQANLLHYLGDQNGDNHVNGVAINPSSLNADQFYDMVLLCRGQATTTGFQVYWDGSLLGSATPSQTLVERNQNAVPAILLGQAIRGFNSSRFKFNEVVIWDEIIDPTNITLVSTGGTTSTGQTLNGSSRTGWVDVSQFENQWTSITAAQIESGVNQIQAGLTQTGTFASEVWSTLTAGAIQSGVNQVQNSVTVTGTYLWTTLTAGAIITGQSYIADSVTISGSVTVPPQASSTAGSYDLGNLKDNIKSILDAANTTTALNDLSGNMSRRVQQVLTVNPEKIPMQASWYPLVTCYVDEKIQESLGFAKNQTTAKRGADVMVVIVGAVSNPLITSNTKDDADEDIELLMENVEAVIRNQSTINQQVEWSFPEKTDYFSLAIDEETHFRTGALRLKCRIFY
jgi:hypothetical protein